MAKFSNYDLTHPPLETAKDAQSKMGEQRLSLEQAVADLAAAGIATPSLDVSILWEHSCKAAAGGDIVGVMSAFVQAIERRKQHEPIAYIIGVKAFWRHDFYVNNAVLIPRPDSETLVEFAINNLTAMAKKGSYTREQPLKIMELGVGSGCILLSIISDLKQEGILCHGLGVDLSVGVLAVAHYNRDSLALNEEVTLLQSDWCEKIDKKQEFSAIIANPPYISLEEWSNLATGVRDFEPRIALTDGGDGLEYYRRISQESLPFIGPEGFIALECGYEQAADVREILSGDGWQIDGIYEDIAGIPRVVVGRKLEI